MSYREEVLREPECRDYVVNVFFAALDTDYTHAKIRSAFQGISLAAWPDPHSPFFHGDKFEPVADCPEKRAFLVFSALGFAVGCIDALKGHACDLPLTPPAEVIQAPTGINQKASLWIKEGPIVTGGFLSYLNPLDKSGVEFVTNKNFFDGYYGGVKYTGLGVGVHEAVGFGVS